jgi:hypothetical protein
MGNQITPKNGETREDLCLRICFLYWVCWKLRLPQDEFVRQTAIRLELSQQEAERAVTIARRYGGENHIGPALIFVILHKYDMLDVKAKLNPENEDVLEHPEYGRMFMIICLKWSDQFFKNEAEYAIGFDRERWEAFIKEV